MRRSANEHFFRLGSTLEGILAAASPTGFLLALAPNGEATSLRLGMAAFSFLFCLLAGTRFFFLASLRKILVCSAALLGVMAGYPAVTTNPFLALTVLVILTTMGFALFDFKIDPLLRLPSRRTARSLYAIRSAAVVPLLLLILVKMIGLTPDRSVFGIIALSALTSQFKLFRLACSVRSRRHIFAVLFNVALMAGMIAGDLRWAMYAVITGVGIHTLILLPRVDHLWSRSGIWWEIITNHSSRVLIFGFFLLCFTGTFLLLFPMAWRNGPIKMIDAAFTATSAVCVTGLTALDTAKDFSFIGQIFILLLIQLGGLGIMTLTAVAFHAFGRRMSLRQESLFTSVTETSHSDLYNSLLMIVRFTLTVEGMGAILLTIFFIFGGQNVVTALWNGIFTAVSAFCNAGFFMDSNNLIPWQKNPFVLHTVAGLIILGGLAPAATLLIPAWIRHRPVPISVRMALSVTAFLLLTGTLFILTFEWNGILKGLSFFDKLNNAWFQSVTLRTAGFNSVDLSGTRDATWVIMMIWMFIGGSPGSTAGGIKTTTFAVLLLTLWTNVKREHEVIFRFRKIPQATVYRAITIFIAGLVVLFSVSLILMVTQDMSGKKILFEVASALGTVGLTIGATPMLDEPGKAIIIMTMFIGRVGPMTLFMFLSDSRPPIEKNYPDAKISIS